MEKLEKKMKYRQQWKKKLGFTVQPSNVKEQNNGPNFFNEANSNPEVQKVINFLKIYFDQKKPKEKETLKKKFDSKIFFQKRLKIQPQFNAEQLPENDDKWNIMSIENTKQQKVSF